MAGENESIVSGSRDPRRNERRRWKCAPSRSTKTSPSSDWRYVSERQARKNGIEVSVVEDVAKRRPPMLRVTRVSLEGRPAKSLRERSSIVLIEWALVSSISPQTSARAREEARREADRSMAQGQLARVLRGEYTSGRVVECCK